jgi:hypothetical protein
VKVEETGSNSWMGFMRMSRQVAMGWEFAMMER